MSATTSTPQLYCSRRQVEAISLARPLEERLFGPFVLCKTPFFERVSKLSVAPLVCFFFFCWGVVCGWVVVVLCGLWLLGCVGVVGGLRPDNFGLSRDRHYGRSCWVGVGWWLVLVRCGRRTPRSEFLWFFFSKPRSNVPVEVVVFFFSCIGNLPRTPSLCLTHDSATSAMRPSLRSGGAHVAGVTPLVPDLRRYGAAVSSRTAPRIHAPRRPSDLL
jgi:hypothetical protein